MQTERLLAVFDTVIKYKESGQSVSFRYDNILPTYILVFDSAKMKGIVFVEDKPDEENVNGIDYIYDPDFRKAERYMKGVLKHDA